MRCRWCNKEIFKCSDTYGVPQFKHLEQSASGYQYYGCDGGLDSTIAEPQTKYQLVKIYTNAIPDRTR